MRSPERTQTSLHHAATMAMCVPHALVPSSWLLHRWNLDTVMNFSAGASVLRTHVLVPGATASPRAHSSVPWKALAMTSVVQNDSSRCHKWTHKTLSHSRTELRGRAPQCLPQPPRPLAVLAWARSLYLSPAPSIPSVSPLSQSHPKVTVPPNTESNRKWEVKKTGIPTNHFQ